MQNIDDTITIEVKSRLDDLFGETADESVEFFGGPQQDASPLKDLKSAVLSIDWEITEEVMNDFIEQVNLLKRRFKEERIVLLFLQLLGSIGKYIQAHGARSHPETFKILNAVFNRLEDVVTNPDLTEPEKKRCLYTEIVKFKQLREKIATERARASGKIERGVDITESHRDVLPAKDAQVKEDEGEKGSLAEPELLENRVVGKQEGREAPIEPALHELPANNGKTPEKKQPAFAAVFSKTEIEGGPVPPDESVSTVADPVQEALDEIKQLIREEFQSLRSQLRLLSRHR